MPLVYTKDHSFQLPPPGGIYNVESFGSYAITDGHKVIMTFRFRQNQNKLEFLIHPKHGSNDVRFKKLNAEPPAEFAGFNFYGYSAHMIYYNYPECLPTVNMLLNWIQAQIEPGANMLSLVEMKQDLGISLYKTEEAYSDKIVSLYDDSKFDEALQLGIECKSHGMENPINRLAIHCQEKNDYIGLSKFISHISTSDEIFSLAEQVYVSEDDGILKKDKCEIVLSLLDACENHDLNEPFRKRILNHLFGVSQLDLLDWPKKAPASVIIWFFENHESFQSASPDTSSSDDAKAIVSSVEHEHLCQSQGPAPSANAFSFFRVAASAVVIAALSSRLF